MSDPYIESMKSEIEQLKQELDVASCVLEDEEAAHQETLAHNNRLLAFWQAASPLFSPHGPVTGSKEWQEQWAIAAEALTAIGEPALTPGVPGKEKP